jgi:TonB family protein
VSERVLVIDFDRRECQRLAQTLRDLGYEVTTATSGAEVRERLSRGMPGLVLLDPMLPGEDGFKLCRDLKRPDRPNPPAIVVASRIFKGQRYRTMAERSGADVFLERPRQEQEIIPTVQRLLPTAAPPIAAEAPAHQAQPEPQPQPEPEPEPEPVVEIDAQSAAAEPEPAAEEVPAPEPPASPAPKPERPAPAAKSSPKAPAEVPGFAVSDDDIDDALERALGGGGAGPSSEPSPGSSPEPQAAPASPAVSTAPQRIARAVASAAQAAAGTGPSPGAADASDEEDDLTEALDGLGIEVAVPEEPRPGSRRQPASEAAPRKQSDQAVGVLESPLGFDPPAESGAHIERRAEGDDELDLELQAESGFASAPPEPEPEPAPAPTPQAPPAVATPAPEAPAEEGDDLDHMLDRAFQGTGTSSGPAGAGAPAEDEHTGPPPFSTPQTPDVPKVPDSLRGMDEGTADLLSSLEELDSSLPSAEPTGWTGTDLTEDVDFRQQDPAQVPTPEEEASLDEVMERLTNTGLGEDDAAKPEQERGLVHGEDGGEAPSGTQPPKRKRKIKLGWLFSFFVGLMAVAVSGTMLLTGDPSEPVTASARHSGGPDPPAAEEPADPGPPVEPAGAASSVGGEDVAAAGEPTEDDERSMRRIPEEEPATLSASAETTPSDADRPDRARPTAPPRPEPRPARESVSADRAEQKPTPARNRAAATDAASQPDPRPASLSTETPATPPATATTEKPPESTPVQPIPVVGLADLDRPLDLLEAPTPPLAAEAREQGISGRVFVNLLVGPEGDVREVRVMIDPGYGLGQAARDAASRWRYTPPRSHGRPVRVWKTEVVEFETAPPTGATG